jgi:hypothetical protein
VDGRILCFQLPGLQVCLFLESFCLLLDLGRLFPEGSHFLVCESQLIVDFFPLLKELLLTSFQLGLLTLQFLLVGRFAAVGVSQQAHALRIRG